MSERPRFALRTIRDGAVRIRGVVFRPDEAYDGRFDGQRWLFGLYWGPPNHSYYGPDGFCRDFVSLWGTEAMAKAKSDAEYEALWPGPNCIDGTFRWEWWSSPRETTSVDE